MNQKQIIYIGLFIGSTIGGLVPTLWGASFLSLWSVLFTAIGGAAGIYAGYKITH